MYATNYNCFRPFKNTTGPFGHGRTCRRHSLNHNPEVEKAVSPPLRYFVNRLRKNYNENRPAIPSVINDGRLARAIIRDVTNVSVKNYAYEKQRK